MAKDPCKDQSCDIADHNGIFDATHRFGYLDQDHKADHTQKQGRRCRNIFRRKGKDLPSDHQRTDCQNIRQPRRKCPH